MKKYTHRPRRGGAPPGGKPGRIPKPSRWAGGRTVRPQNVTLSYSTWDHINALAERLEWSASRVMDAVLADTFGCASFDPDTYATHLERLAEA